MTIVSRRSIPIRDPTDISSNLAIIKTPESSPSRLRLLLYLAGECRLYFADQLELERLYFFDLWVLRSLFDFHGLELAGFSQIGHQIGNGVGTERHTDEIHTLTVVGHAAEPDRVCLVDRIGQNIQDLDGSLLSFFQLVNDFQPPLKAVAFLFLGFIAGLDLRKALVFSNSLLQ